MLIRKLSPRHLEFIDVVEDLRERGFVDKNGFLSLEEETDNLKEKDVIAWRRNYGDYKILCARCCKPDKDEALNLNEGDMAVCDECKKRVQ